MSGTPWIARTVGLARLGGAAWRARQGGGRATRDVAARLGALHGLPQKVGQLLVLGELDQPESAFWSLTESVSPLPPPVALRQLESELGRPLAECFRTVDGRGIAASLGQVHRAALLDGTPVAVKLQYPGIAEATRLDLRFLELLAQPLGGWRGGLDATGYQRELARRLGEELDYQREAAMQSRFADLLADEPGLSVPRVIPEFSTRRVLTSTWLEGVTFPATAAWSSARREALGRILVRFLWRSLLEWRLLHADLHPGNLRFSVGAESPVIGLLDFGHVEEIDSGVSRWIGWLLHHGAAGGGSSEVELLDAFVGLGFIADLLEPMRHRLPAVADLLTAPVARAGRFDAREWHLGPRLAEVLGPDRWNFRVAGPPGLMGLLRALVAVTGYLRALRVAVDWRTELEAVAPSGGPGSHPEPVLSPREEARVLAQHLRVQIREDDRVKVELTFMARATANLPDLIPAHLAPVLRERGIDLEAVAARAVGEDCPPQSLFQLVEGSRTIRVWLE